MSNIVKMSDHVAEKAEKAEAEKAEAEKAGAAKDAQAQPEKEVLSPEVQLIADKLASEQAALNAAREREASIKQEVMQREGIIMGMAHILNAVKKTQAPAEAPKKKPRKKNKSK